MGIEKHWWSPQLDDLKQQCIEITVWRYHGCPRTGEINNNKNKTNVLLKRLLYRLMRDSMLILQISSVKRNFMVFGNLGGKDSVLKILKLLISNW